MAKSDNQNEQAKDQASGGGSGSANQTSSNRGEKEYVEVASGARLTRPSDAETKRRVDNGEIRELTKEERQQDEDRMKAAGQRKSEHDRVR